MAAGGFGRRVWAGNRAAANGVAHFNFFRSENAERDIFRAEFSITGCPPSNGVTGGRAIAEMGCREVS